MKKDILYFNTLEDIKIVDMLRTTSKEKELPNQIILTILSAGAGVGTPIFNKEPSEIGTKFILDDKEITSDDFLVVSISNSGGSYNFFGLLFEDANPHILKISLINPSIPNFQQITKDKEGCSANSITSAIISSSITEIEKYAFTMCSNLTSVTIGNSVASIGNSAFYGCTSLTSVTIPNSVTSIGGSAFEGCRGLTSVTIPNSVTSIGRAAFAFCSGLRSITSLAVTAPTISSNTFLDVKTNGVLIIPLDSDYSAWISTGNYYLGLYNWTKIEDA